MGDCMADVDVDERLGKLEADSRVHSEILKTQSETLTKMSDVLVQQATMQQANIDITRRLDDHERRFDQVMATVAGNREQIVKWSGGIAVILTISGFVIGLHKLGVLFAPS